MLLNIEAKAEMESNPGIKDRSSKPPEYLPGFVRLNHKAYLYVPTENSDTRHNKGSRSLRQSPTLIYLSTWMNAHDRHIAKYVHHYRELYPSSSMLLVKNSYWDSFFNSSFRQKLELQPIITILRSFVNKHRKLGAIGGGMLVHALSNGGSGNISLVSQLYRKETGEPLPVKAFILDSAPGKVRLVDAVITLTHNTPRIWYILWPLRLLFGFLLAVFYSIPQLLGRETLSSRMWQILNSRHPEYISSRSVRSYIYSEHDRDIRAADVEAHACDAADAGFHVVEKAKFHGSAHVAHMRHDRARYWEVIQRTWLAALSGPL